MIKSHTFNREKEQEYRNEFQRYVIDVLYGDTLVMGSDIEDEYKDK